MGAPRAAVNRRIRQDNLREWLSEKCTAQHLVDNIIKIENLDSDSSTFAQDIQKLKTANEQRLKILDKYLPSLKQEETFNGDAMDKEVEELTEDDLKAIIAGG